MNSRRLTSLAAALVLSLGFAVGCADDDDPADPVDPDPTTEMAPLPGDGGTGTDGDGTSGDGTAGDGTAGDGTAGDGTAGNGTAGDGGDLSDN